MTNENPVDWNDYANAVAPLPTATNEMMTGVAPTNTISVNPDDGSGGAPEVSGGGGAFTWLVVIGAAVAGLAWLGKKFKASTIAFEKSAEDGLIDGILGVVAKDAPNRDALRAELAEAVSGGGALRSGPLADVLRIEVSYEKRTTGRYGRCIAVMRRKTDSTAALTRIEDELGWEYIPAAIREQFIKTRENKVVRLVYDAGQRAGA